MFKTKSMKSVLVSSAVGLVFSGQAQAFEQSRSVECIAPANPGGGWDFTCRSVSKVLSDLDYIKGNVQTVNTAVLRALNSKCTGSAHYKTAIHSFGSLLTKILLYYI